jgi:hypothetical protein
MHHVSATTVASTLLALCAGAASLGVHAAESPRQINSGPVNHCQAALPVFDGKIRKRPLAVVNEGDSNAFVTCSLSTIGPRFFSTSTFFEFYVSYNGPQPSADITCTVVGGVEGGTGNAAPEFDTRTGTFERGAVPDSFTYIPEQFNGDRLPDVISFQCNLPPGGAIHDMYLRVNEDIGD